jgi:hypothetical protein
MTSTTNTTTVSHYSVSIKHEAFGTEGSKLMHCSKRMAKDTAREMARKAGHGWVPVVEDRSRLEIDGTVRAVSVRK